MNTKIKVMHINNTLNIGGIELFLMNVIKHTDRNQYDISILTYSKEVFDLEEQIKQYGVKIHKIDEPSRISTIKHMRQIAKVLEESKPDVLVSHTYFGSAYVILVGLMMGIKTRVVHSHTAMASSKVSVFKSIRWVLSRFIINTASTNRLACSAEAGVAMYGKAAFDTIPNGVDLNRFKFNSLARLRLRKQLNIRDSTVVVGHVGRIAYPKNHEFLIKTFSEYQLLNADSKLILVGDGPKKEHIEKIAKEMGLNNKVIFLGNRHDISELMSSMDLFVFPSLYEGLPVSLVEAQANGVYILASDTVSNEVKVTARLAFLSLKKGPQEWARKMYSMKTQRAIIAPSKKLLRYDIANTVSMLDKIFNGGNE
jgi:glycosyltransferase involved in cell wall biosynthesis